MSETFDTELPEDWDYVLSRLQGPMWAMLASGILQLLCCLAILATNLIAVGFLISIWDEYMSTGDQVFQGVFLVIRAFTTVVAIVFAAVTALWMRTTYVALHTEPTWTQAQRVAWVSVGLGVGYAGLLMLAVFQGCSCCSIFVAPVVFLSSVGSGLWLHSVLSSAELQDALRPAEEEVEL